MESLPDTSQGNVKQGLWFVFPLSKATVRAWGSAGALERIYVDATVVSEKRSVGRESTHTFAIDGDNYEVSFKTLSYLRAHIECRLTKNDEVLRTQSVRYVGAQTSVKRLLLSVLAGGAAGATIILLKWPFWTVLPLLAVIIVFQAKTRPKIRGYVFSE
jgi:hypothetical protein